MIILQEKKKVNTINSIYFENTLSYDIINNRKGVKNEFEKNGSLRKE